MYIDPDEIRESKSMLKSCVIVFSSWLIGVAFGYFWCYLVLTR